MDLEAPTTSKQGQKDLKSGLWSWWLKKTKKWLLLLFYIASLAGV
jgi:hypothetical protein